MKLEERNKPDMTESDGRLFEELDKGIDSMENGRTMPHDKAMQMIRETLKEYPIRLIILMKNDL
ncbi:MAG: hypothetical protein NC416_00365 [Eubacterium sp.]|nr:hypothetical protein [Eubacterium sp.]